MNRTFRRIFRLRLIELYYLGGGVGRGEGFLAERIDGDRAEALRTDGRLKLFRDRILRL